MYGLFKEEMYFVCSKNVFIYYIRTIKQCNLNSDVYFAIINKYYS